MENKIDPERSEEKKVCKQPPDLRTPCISKALHKRSGRRGAQERWRIANLVLGVNEIRVQIKTQR